MSLLPVAVITQLYEFAQLELQYNLIIFIEIKDKRYISVSCTSSSYSKRSLEFMLKFLEEVLLISGRDWLFVPG